MLTVFSNNRFKRLAGDQWGYKHLCTGLIEAMKL